MFSCRMAFGPGSDNNEWIFTYTDVRMMFENHAGCGVILCHEGLFWHS